MTDDTADKFPLAVAIVLEEEGVFSDDPNDVGGETIFGIARASHPAIPWPPTKDQSIAIYQAEYWTAHRCGEMPWPWGLGVFDGEVNQGNVIRLAQEALGVAQDGVVGPATLAAMIAAAAPLFDQFLALRALSYVDESGFPRFGKGWMARLARIARGAAQHA